MHNDRIPINIDKEPPWVMSLKELEHRKLGWSVLILKYDLGKSFSKEMWCKMADTKKIFDYIL